MDELEGREEGWREVDIVTWRQMNSGNSTCKRWGHRRCRAVFRTEGGTREVVDDLLKLSKYRKGVIEMEKGVIEMEQVAQRQYVVSDTLALLKHF